jgi:hypothetical protein
MTDKNGHVNNSRAIFPFRRRFGSVILAACLAAFGVAQVSADPEGSQSAEDQNAASAAPVPVLANLETDGDGLYSDSERKALLDVFLERVPELQKILDAEAVPVAQAASNYQEDFEEGKKAEGAVPQGVTSPQVFDVDGDGKVTIKEQEAGRPPLSLLVPRRIVESEPKIPWTIDIFPEWISSAYLQEDVPVGPVISHVPRGTIEAAAEQRSIPRQPAKVTERGGVEFAADSGRFLLAPGKRDARWDYRWVCLTFRIDGNTGTSGSTTLLDLNWSEIEGSNRSSPKIWYDKQTGLHVQYVGKNKGGLDRRILSGGHVVADGKTWNVLVCGVRYGQVFASLNGVPLSSAEKQPDRFSGEWPKETVTLVGGQDQGNMAWAYDALVMGLTEPSEEMVRKLTGWAAHRLGFAQGLPESHPYRLSRPVLDAEDFPARYVHDDKKWNEWGQKVKDKTVTRLNAGGPRVEPKGFQRVFFDDFRANRISPSSSGEGDLWMGPGFNISVGVDAPLLTPGDKPDAYSHDAAKQQQRLSLVNDGKRWRGSAIYSVNDLGHGYTWKGPKIIRIRCMFPKMDKKNLAGGLFPAFWSYDPSNLLWRTSNRIEVDWFEFDGQNGKWLNGLSTHYHYPYIKNEKNVFAKNTNSYKRYKAYGGELTPDKSRIPGGIDIWDGKFHTWEWVVEKDMTYANVTIPDNFGRDRWVEIFRCPTAPVYLEALDLQLDYALKGKHGVPKDGQRQDFVVDWIEVLQKTSDLAVVPEPFKLQPVLAGKSVAGETVTCEANLEGITDIRYYWFADGYPLTWGTSNTFGITKAEAGKEIRCMVKAVGARDMPEAWSNPVR